MVAPSSPRAGYLFDRRRRSNMTKPNCGRDCSFDKLEQISAAGTGGAKLGTHAGQQLAEAHGTGPFAAAWE
jgi:hypothetical protein